GAAGGGDTEKGAGGVDGKVAVADTKKAANNDEGDDAPDKPVKEAHAASKSTAKAPVEHHEAAAPVHHEEEKAPPPKPPGDEKPVKKGKCDPVLDFDCKPDGSQSDSSASAGNKKAKAAAEESGGDVKEKLA